jgi:hypothetical protein
MLAGCSSLLPRQDTIVEGPWKSFQESQQNFDKIIPYKTTVHDLQALNLNPESNPNISILNYADVLRRFVPPTSINGFELDEGIRDCLVAKASCKGYEIDNKSIKRKRYGNFWADFMNFRRKTQIDGWRFNGVILIKDNVVVYKLSGGQPVIHEFEENNNPLGPLQGTGESMLRNAF